MRDLTIYDNLRFKGLGPGDSQNGAFIMKIKGETYSIIASNGGGWDHVSVSHKHKIPSWKVMNIVKDLFFYENEMVMQLHPPKKDYVNIDNNCLHLWRPQQIEIPAPPLYMV